MTFEMLVSKLKSSWSILSVFAALVFSIVGDVLAPPPTLWREAGEALGIGRLAIIVVISAVISAILAGRIPPRRGTFLLFAPSAIVLFLIYSFVRAEYSCPYASGRVAIGWQYLPLAREYLAKNPNHDCELLIADFIGETDKIWPAAQIGVVWAVLILTYIAGVSLIAALIVRLLHHLVTSEP